MIDEHESGKSSAQPNKPGGGFNKKGEPREAGAQQAVKNQSVVSPEDYPEPAAGDTDRSKP